MAELCARFEVEQPDAPGGRGVIYVKSRWFTTRFSLSVSDGLNSWLCEALEEDVTRKAFSWDWTVAKYLEDAERRLGFQDSTSNYSFSPLEDGARKFSWTIENGGVQLKAHWRLEKSRNAQETTCDILDFLMRGSSRISEELQRKKRSFEHMKAEAERAQAQSQKFKDQKVQFEADIYKKFVAVLNSKKTKLRQLRELALQSAPSEASKGKNEMVDETESEDELDDSEDEDNSASKETTPIKGRGLIVENETDDDSGATDILPADPPTPDASNMDTGPSHSDLHDADHKQEKLNAQTSVLKHPTDTVTDAAMLLSGSTYTSAPRKRRRL